MISYLGVTIDEVLQTFEDSFAFSDDRADRVFEEEIEVAEASEEEEASAETLEADGEDDVLSEDDLEDEEIEDVFVDEDGQLHAFGQNLPFAAEAAINFLTDYIVTDDIDSEWLTLDQARGVLLALRVILPTLEDVPEVEAAYSFSITRDPETGFPNYINMQSLSSDEEHTESLTFTATSYEGVITDATALEDLIESSDIPEDDRDLLESIITEAAFTLGDEQCEIVLDLKAFCTTIAELAAAHKNSSSDKSSTEAASEVTH